MIIGIPKEIMHDEARVSATPETVGKFVKDGFEVMVEKGAGEGADHQRTRSSRSFRSRSRDGSRACRRPVAHHL